MKKYFAFLLTFIMIFSLAACGGEGDTDAVKTDTKEEMEVPTDVDIMVPGENIDRIVDFIHPGSLRSDVRTSDAWYVVGEENPEYFIYFVQVSGNELSYYLYDHGEETTIGSLAMGDDGHLKDASGAADVVFMDTFTCYDFVSETFYSRGDLPALQDQFIGSIMWDEDDNENTIEFAEDGTCIEFYNGNDYDMTWWIPNTNYIYLTEGDGYNYEFEIIYDQDGNVDHLQQYMGRTMVFAG